MSEVSSSRPGHIYFVRHGESVANELNVFSGTCDVPLTDFGRAQARRAGEDIRRQGLRFDEIHRSELIRVRETTEIVSRLSGNEDAPVTISPALNERDFGNFTGRNKTLLRRSVGYAEFERAIHSFNEAPPRGESLAKIHARVQEYYERELVPARDSGKTVLVVCSKYIIEMFALISLGLGAEDYFDFKLPNSKAFTEESLRDYVQGESHGLKEIADRTSYFSTTIILAAALAGIGFKLTTGLSLPIQATLATSTLSLAVMTFFASLMIDLKKGFRAHALRENLFYWGVRALAGVLLFHLSGDHLLLRIFSILLFTPPPSSLPGIALMLGGVGYPAFTLAVVGTLVAGLLEQRISGTSALGVLLLIGCVLPFALAQQYRRTRPSQARSLGEKWGFLTVLALAAFAFTTVLRVAPGSLAGFSGFTVETLFLPPLALLLFKLLGFATSAALCPDDSSRRIDTYLGHGTVNIVFLTAVLGAGSRLGASPALTLSLTLSVFAFILFDERLLQHLFEKDFRGEREVRILAQAVRPEPV